MVIKLHWAIFRTLQEDLTVKLVAKYVLLWCEVFPEEVIPQVSS